MFLAQVDAGKLNFELRPVALETLVADCVEAAQPTAAAKEIELTSSAQELPVQLQGDPARLAQVLDNLVSNALKFTPFGGSVEVSLQTVDGVAVIEVSDTGMGLAEDEQDQLFERFFRARALQRTRSPERGSVSRSPRRSSSATVDGSGWKAPSTSARLCASSSRSRSPSSGARRKRSPPSFAPSLDAVMLPALIPFSHRTLPVSTLPAPI